MQRGRAFRRYQRKRALKKWIKWYKDRDWDICQDPEWLYYAARKTNGRGSMGCGCMMCANPRKWKGEDGGRTRAELKNEIYFKQQLEEIECSDKVRIKV